MYQPLGVLISPTGTMAGEGCGSRYLRRELKLRRIFGNRSTGRWQERGEPASQIQVCGNDAEQGSRSLARPRCIVIHIDLKGDLQPLV